MLVHGSFDNVLYSFISMRSAILRSGTLVYACFGLRVVLVKMVREDRR